MMSSNLSIVFRWSIPIVLAILAIGYSAYRRGELTYWDGAVGNWLATLFGIVTGVPVALFLERRRIAHDADGKTREMRRVRVDVLSLIQHELVDDLQRLQTRITTKDAVPIDPLKSSIWTAMGDAGNLVHVSEPMLISALSNAYRLIAIIAGREQHVMRLVYSATVQFPDGETAAMKVLKETADFYPLASDAIAVALSEIEKALSSELGHLAPAATLSRALK